MIRRLTALAALLVSIAATAAENWTSIASYRHCLEVADAAAGPAHPAGGRQCSLVHGKATASSTSAMSEDSTSRWMSSRMIMPPSTVPSPVM